MKHLDTQVWKEAVEIYASFSDYSLSQSLTYLEGQLEIPVEVKNAVIILLNSEKQASQFFSEKIDKQFRGISLNQRPYYSGQIIDKYKLIEQLGHGGMSQVFRAKRIDSDEQKPVAIKIFIPVNNAKELLSHFINEQKLLSKLYHPNIVHLLHGGETEQGIFYLVMSLVEQAIPLDEFCSAKLKTTREKIQLIKTCADALSYLHGNLIIHRDLKPDNILIDTNNEVKIVDFGIAKTIDKHNPNNKNTIFALTPSYAAPEQINCQNISVKTDVFSLGIITLGLFTNKKPLPEDRLIKSCINDEEYINKLLKNMALENDLKNIISKAVKQDPDKRYPTMNLFAQDLSAWLENKTVIATSDSWYYQLTKFAQRKKALFASLLTLLTTMLFGILLLSWQYRQTTLEKYKAVEIKNFMMDLFSSADPEKSIGKNLTAFDLLQIASEQVQFKNFSDASVKADVLANIGIAMINLGSHTKGESVLLNAIDVSSFHLEAQLKLIAFYIDTSQIDKAGEWIKFTKLNQKNNYHNKDTLLKIDMLYAQFLLLIGNDREALKLANQTHEKIKNTNKGIELIKSARIVAHILLKQGKFKSAIELSKEVLEIVKDTDVNTSIEIFRLEKTLAFLLSENNENEEAIKVIQNTISRIKSKLGEDHPIMITALGTQCEIYNIMGLSSDSLIYAKKSYQLAVSKYGEKSKLAQNGLYLMAAAKSDLNDFQGALNDLFEAVELSKENYGELHYITVSGSVILSTKYLLNNQSQKAVENAKSIYLKAKKGLGETSHSTIFARTTYIEILFKLGRTNGLFDRAKNNYQISLESLGENNSNTIYALKTMKKLL